MSLDIRSIRCKSTPVNRKSKYLDLPSDVLFDYLQRHFTILTRLD